MVPNKNLKHFLFLINYNTLIKENIFTIKISELLGQDQAWCSISICISNSLDYTIVPKRENNEGKGDVVLLFFALVLVLVSFSIWIRSSRNTKLSSKHNLLFRFLLHEVT